MLLKALSMPHIKSEVWLSTVYNLLVRFIIIFAMVWSFLLFKGDFYFLAVLGLSSVFILCLDNDLGVAVLVLYESD